MFKDSFFPSVISTARNGFCKKNALAPKKQEKQLTEVLCRLCTEEKDPRIYIDTCALLHQHGLRLLDALENVFYSHHIEAYIPTSVLYELENVGYKNSVMQNQIRKILERITELEQTGSVRIVLTSSPRFTDAGLLSRFVNECQFYDIILFTQDRELAKKAQQLPSFLSGCVNANHEIRVYKLNEQGGLIKHNDRRIFEREVNSHDDTKNYLREQFSYPCFYSQV